MRAPDPTAIKELLKKAVARKPLGSRERRLALRARGYVELWASQGGHVQSVQDETELEAALAKGVTLSARVTKRGRMLLSTCS